ncbi:MAG: IS66 family insertion sequence element accessory protein TnpB [Spirochaetia bacterium]|jgi:transposase
MHIEWEKVKIYVKPGPTDMRKQINGLSVIVKEDIGIDPFTGHLFIFCNKPRNRLKVLYWDKNGFCLWLKRLEKHKFPWPKNREGVLELKEKELRMLLGGIDFFQAHQEITYEKVC